MLASPPATPRRRSTDRQRRAHALTAAFARRVVSLARLAPSVHNTQPWLWYAEGERLELWADRERALPVLDPRGRQLVLSCGASLLHAVLAVREAGRSCQVRLLPDEERRDHLATLTVGEEEPPTGEELALAAGMRRRHTARGVFEAREVPAAVRERLRAAAEAGGAVLHLVPADDRVLLSVLLAHADRRQATDPDYAAELRGWVRERAGDGVPARAAAEADGGHRQTDVVLRDFGVGSAGADPTGEPTVEKPLIAVLLTQGDEPWDWLAAGQALARVLLTGAVEGIGASPLNQVVDDPGTRQLLRRELRLVGWPQMVLRLGYGHGAGAPRREVDDVLYVAAQG